jgi:hypothetical protein
MRCIVKGVALAAATLAATLAFGQAGPGSSPPYHVDNETALKGKIAEIKVVPDWMGADGYNIMLQTPEGTIVHVDVATAKFLSFLDFTAAAGDNVEITGCWVHVKGENVFLARRVQKQKVTVSVRDADGRPVW